MKGNIFGVDNANILKFGIGPKALLANLKGNITITVFFSSALNAVDSFIMNDKTMYDFLGNTGADITKALIASGISTVVLGAFVVGGVPVNLIGGSFFFFASSTTIGLWLEELDTKNEWSKSVIDSWKKSQGVPVDAKKEPKK